MATFTYDDLIEWSEEKQSSGKERLRPWQRDALRRILENGSLSEADIDELAALAKDAHSETSVLAVNVATKAHVSPSGATLPAVSLTGVRDIARVNALGEGPISFAKSGLTVFFGENGSGKSGVGRILKRACRARDAGGRVRPNVFEPEPSDPASATIDFEVDGVPDTCDWVDGEDAGDALATVTVFDASCAVHQVQREEVLTYTPELLTVFRELASGCGRVRGKLEAERDMMGGTPPALLKLQSDLGTETKAGAFANGISTKSQQSELETLVSLGEAEAVRLAELRDALRSDPLKAASDLEARRRRVVELDTTLSTAGDALSDDALHVVETRVGEAAASAEAAKTAREAFSEESDLEGVGSDAWKRLWQAAREYSDQEAYPSESFPVTRDGAQCVLCQQPFADEEAAARLQSFEGFVTAEVQKSADKAASELSATIAALRSLVLPRRSRDAAADAGILDPQDAARLRSFIVALKRRRLSALRRASGGVVVPCTPIPDRPDLDMVQRGLATEVANLKAAGIADERLAMEGEKRELEARVLLAPHKEAIEDEIRRLQHRERLDLIAAECNATGITRKQGEAEKLIVTGRFKSRFRQDLNAIGFSETPVDIVAGAGDQGKRPYGVRLTAKPEVPPREVLSEGEATCVAIAGMLSELSITENRSALVLDDPVSSLDQNYRDRVARRLCEEAKVRQVIVFTHDVAFLYQLDKYASSLTVPQRQVSLIRGGTDGGHGRAEDEPPWVTMKVNDRIKRLRRELEAARKLQKSGDGPGYEREARRIYEALRQTWERAIEEVLLNGVVLRFDDGVHTQQLRLVADDLPLSDIELVDTEMAYCSGFVHDRAKATPARPPGPEIVEGDIKKIDDWAKGIRKRRDKRR